MMKIKADKTSLILLICIVVLIFSSLFFLKPQIADDSATYLNAINFLKTGEKSLNFVPNRILTTFGALEVVIFLSKIFGSETAVWLAMNIVFYFISAFIFYKLLNLIFEDKKTALLGTLFLISNYAFVTFGLDYLMDIGGWTFYIVSLYFSSLYLKTKENKWLWLSAATVGVGGLFKEYAFLAYIVIFGLIVFTEWRQWGKIIKKIFFTGILAFTPMIVLNIYTFLNFNYTYLNWFLPSTGLYPEVNRPLEYIKSFGSLYNFGWFLFLGGAYLLLRRIKEVFKDEKLLFIWLVILSSTLVFVWPVVTRVLFITMPAIVLVTSLFIRKMNKWWYAVIPLLVLYVLSSFFMDSYILNAVSIDKVFSYF